MENIIGKYYSLLYFSWNQFQEKFLLKKSNNYGAVHKVRHLFFEIFDPPSPHVTHFTK